MCRTAGGGADSRNAASRRGRRRLARGLLQHRDHERAGRRAADRSGKPPPQPAAAPARDDLAAATIDRPRGRWVAVRWSELPGWDGDRVAEFWPAFLRSCERPTPRVADACAKARRQGSGTDRRDAVRAWLQRQLRPYRVESAERDPIGLATGYFEPLVEASRTPRRLSRPLYAPPPDLATRQPYWTRHRSRPCRRRSAACAASEIAWLRDPLDALCCRCRARAASLRGRARRGPRTRPRRLCGAQRPAVPLGRPLAHRSGRAARERGVVAGDPRLGAPASGAASTR